MPFVSSKQSKKCFALKEHHQNKGWNCEEFAEHTNYSKLPEKKAELPQRPQLPRPDKVPLVEGRAAASTPSWANQLNVPPSVRAMFDTGHIPSTAHTHGYADRPNLAEMYNLSQPVVRPLMNNGQLMPAIHPPSRPIGLPKESSAQLSVVLGQLAAEKYSCSAIMKYTKKPKRKK